MVRRFVLIKVPNKSEEIILKKKIQKNQNIDRKIDLHNCNFYIT